MKKRYMIEYVVRTYVEAIDTDQARDISSRLLDEMEGRGQLAHECAMLDVFELDENGDMI